MKEKIARHYGYTILLATTIPANASDNVLEKAAFKKVEPFVLPTIEHLTRLRLG